LAEHSNKSQRAICGDDPLKKHDVVGLFLTAMFLILATGATVVFADTQQLFDETIVVNNLSFYSITRTIDISDMTNVQIQGTIDVLSGTGTITVYVMNADGYVQFQQNHQAPQSALYEAQDVVSQTVSVPIATSGTYYIVLDNQNSLLTSKTVRVQLTLSFDRPFLGSPLFYAIVGALLVAGVAGVAFMRHRQKGRKSPSQVAGTEIGFKHCTQCGARIPEIARICQACGKGQT
jgi:hypothetical protein